MGSEKMSRKRRSSPSPSFEDDKDRIRKLKKRDDEQEKKTRKEDDKERKRRKRDNKSREHSDSREGKEGKTRERHKHRKKRADKMAGSDDQQEGDRGRITTGYVRRQKASSRPRLPTTSTPPASTAGMPPSVRLPTPAPPAVRLPASVPAILSPGTVSPSAVPGHVQHSPDPASTIPFYLHTQPSSHYYPPAVFQQQYPPTPPLGFQYVLQPVSAPAPATAQGTPPSESSIESRMPILPDGETFFPSRQPVHRITEIIRGMYDAPYLSWKKIPQDVRDLWFREFEKDFMWHSRDAKQIRKNFERRASARMSDMFGDMRKSQQRAPWLGDALWEELNKLWGTPDFIKKRAQGKANRASDVGGVGSALSSGGSVPMTEHKRRLEKTLGRVPTALELYERTHKRQQDQTWVDDRAQQTAEGYMKLMESRGQASSGEGSSRQASDYDLWCETVGGRKKGRVYGLGAEGAAHEARSSYFSEQTTQGTQIDEVERLNRHILRIDEDNARLNAEMVMMRAQIATLEGSRGRGKAKLRREHRLIQIQID